MIDLSIRWPDRYAPARTAVHAGTEIDCSASPEDVWHWLVRAADWPTWCPEFKGVKIFGGGTSLELDSKFHWSAFGVPLDSIVMEFVPPERIAWSARGLGIDAYHAWLIERSREGCHVTTEENQNGWAARLNNLLRPSFMRDMQRIWLERLDERAKGTPQRGSKS
jgi:hypothetical protein